MTADHDTDISTATRLSKLPVSAVIITLNAERYLERVLTALAICDDVIVVDSGSTDHTIHIAQTCGARVESRTFQGFGPMKREAVALARYDWVLSVDADEVVDDEAMAALATLRLNDPRQAFRIRRRNYIGDTEVRYGAWNPDWCLRLFNRRCANFSTAVVHESVQTAGPIATWPGSIIHYSFAHYADVFARCGKYAHIKTQRLRDNGRRAHAVTLLLRGIWGFSRSYIFKRGFLDGRAGFMVALSVALDATLALAQASETSRSDVPLK